MNFNLIIIIFSIFISLNATSNSDGVVNCQYTQDDLEILKLIDNFEAQSRFNATLEAKKIILKRCQELKDNGNNSVVIRNNKVKLSEFSDRYSTQDEAYFCKNNSGYSAYLSQLVQRINLFSREAERKKREALYGKPSKRRVSRVSSQANIKEKVWICTNPFAYIKRESEKDEAHMLDHINAHGKDSCRLLVE